MSSLLPRSWWLRSSSIIASSAVGPSALPWASHRALASSSRRLSTGPAASTPTGAAASQGHEAVAGQTGSNDEAGRRRTRTSQEDELDMPLSDIVFKAISATGPMPVARYMHLCLSHPSKGYYTAPHRGDVFGKEGDFITSPEISQTFGEILAIYLITRWQANGSPPRVRLLELGPGRGTLMADILRTFLSFPEIAHAVQTVDLVESSPVMRGLQQAKLGDLAGGRVRWFDRVEDVPKTDAFTLFVAHEFFDALPIHILQRVDPPSSSSSQEASSDSDRPTFRELLVTHTPPSTTLHLTLSPTPTPHSTLLPTTAPHYATVPVGERVEVCPAAFGTMRRLGALLEGAKAGGGGSGLVVDYGKDGWTGESFRAFKDHAAVSPFDHIGTSDQTSNVDFAYLRHALGSLPAKPPLTLGPIGQAEFLESMGLSIRLAELLKLPAFAEGTRRAELEQACERLVDRNGMGSEYLFFGVESPPGDDGSVLDRETKVYPFHGLM